MSDPLVDTYTGLDARLKLVDVITNNLANANTTGFKRDFGHVFETELGVVVGTQVAAGTVVDMRPGDVVSTGNELDAAFGGPGLFFVIDTPNGRRYTSTGAFALNEAGELVTKDGMKVLSTSDSPITPGEGKLEIRDGGVVTVDGNEIATLKVVKFEDNSKVQKEGLSRYTYTGPAGGIQTVSDPPVKGGYLERSNVNAIDEMVHLMTAYREFESVQRALKTLMVEMNDKLISELGKLG